MYRFTTSLVHVLCIVVVCKSILLLKVSVAPDILKVWKNLLRTDMNENT